MTRRRMTSATALLVATFLTIGTAALPASAAGVDAWITYPKKAVSVGIGIVGDDGLGQTLVLVTRRGVREQLSFIFQNEGIGVDGITVTAQRPPKGFRVRYTWASGTIDITDAVHGAGYTLPDQDVGDSWAVVAYVKARPNAPRTGSWLVTGTSTTDPNAHDTVGVKVRVRN